jgi:hypothetical protein
VSRDSYLDQKPYNYCESDPVNTLDPSGHDLEQIKKKLPGIAVGGTVGAIIRIGIIVGGLALLPVTAPAWGVGAIVVGAGIIGGAIGGAISGSINGDDPGKGAIAGGVIGGVGGVVGLGSVPLLQYMQNFFKGAFTLSGA